MTEGIRQLAYTYTIAYIDCHQQKVKANKERFEYLLEQLEVAQEKRGWWNWIKERWYASKKEDVEAYLKNCEEVFQLRREVAELYELVNSWEDLQQRYREIKSIWDAYWEILGRNDNIASYEGGKLFIFVASSLVPGVGQLSKAKRVTAVLEELKGFTKTRWDELVARVRGGLQGAGNVGTYTTKIRWGILDVDARPFGNKGYWGKRIAQNDTRVDAFELKVNPNNESFYVEHPNGGFVQFENLNVNALQDGKMVLQPNNSMYRVYDKSEFLRQKVLDEAIRQTQAANAKGLTVEWLVSDQTAVNQLTQFFTDKNVNVVVKYLAE